MKRAWVFSVLLVLCDPLSVGAEVARYNSGGSDFARAIAVGPSGNVYVTGQSCQSQTNCDYATVAYDRNLKRLWVARYSGPANGEDDPSAIATDSLGNVYVTGESKGSETNTDYATVAYDANGNELWVARYNGPGNWGDSAVALAVGPSGTIYVTGYSSGSERTADYATVAYDSSGNELWVVRYNGPGEMM
ncbi:MAG: SBBP repeat-containing protein [Thermodesulfovibrionales bacterium]